MLRDNEITSFEDFLSYRKQYINTGHKIIYDTLKILGNSADLSEADWISLGFNYRGVYSIVTRITNDNGCIGLHDNHGFRHEYFNHTGNPYPYLPNLVDVVYNLLEYRDYVTGSNRDK